MSDPGAKLTVVSTGPNEKTGEHSIILEDEGGFAFEVPMNWLDPEMQEMFTSDASDGEKGWSLHHQAFVGAPPGELEKVWRRATIDGLVEMAGGDASSAFGPGNTEADVKSALDVWKEHNPNPLPDLEDDDDEGGFFGAAPVSTLPVGMPGTPLPPRAVQPEQTYSSLVKVKRPAPPTVVRKENIPPGAGSGWGNWDETWDQKKQRWVKR